jgi:hypothetical protein
MTTFFRSGCRNYFIFDTLFQCCFVSVFPQLKTLYSSTSFRAGETMIYGLNDEDTGGGESSTLPPMQHFKLSNLRPEKPEADSTWQGKEVNHS